MEWISVNDRLPDNSEDVLTYDDDNKIFALSCYFTLDGKEYHWEYRDSTSGICSTVTHWMPLPEPPKE